MKILNEHVYNDDVLKIYVRIRPSGDVTGTAKSSKPAETSKKQPDSPETKDEEHQDGNFTEAAHEEGAEEETPRESDPIVDPDEHEHKGKLFKRPASKDDKKDPPSKEQGKPSKGSSTRPAASTEEPPAKRLRSKQSTDQLQDAKAPAQSSLKLIPVKRSKSSTDLDKNVENEKQLPQASKKKQTAAKTKAVKATATPKKTSRAAPEPAAKPAPQPTPQQRSDGLASFDLMAET